MKNMSTFFLVSFLSMLQMNALFAHDPLMSDPLSDQKSSDLSTTVVLPRYSLGNSELVFSFKSDMVGVCRTLGFENYLEGSATLKHSEEPERALVNSTGKLKQIVRDSSEYILESITCYNGSYEQETSYESSTNNRDGTTTLLRPRLVRGNRAYFFDYENDQGICRAMGFKSHLPGSSSLFASGASERGAVDVAGKFKALRTGGIEYAVESITCY